MERSNRKSGVRLKFPELVKLLLLLLLLLRLLAAAEEGLQRRGEARVDAIP